MVEVKDVEIPSVSYSHSLISVGNVEIPISGTNMRLLTRMSYKEEEVLGVNNQGIIEPLEVERRTQFATLGSTEGQCSKTSEASTTLLKWLRKRDDGNTSA